MSADRDPVTVDGLRDGDTFTSSSGARFVVEAPFSRKPAAPAPIGAIPHDAPASTVISDARRRSSLPLSRDERRSAIVLAVLTVPAPAPWIVRALCETLARSEYDEGWMARGRFEDRRAS